MENGRSMGHKGVPLRAQQSYWEESQPWQISTCEPICRHDSLEDEPWMPKNLKTSPGCWGEAPKNPQRMDNLKNYLKVNAEVLDPNQKHEMS